MRLASQEIGGTEFATVKNVLDWMGAIQAQDYAMAKWAIGIRLPNSLDEGIRTAIDQGDILRTHILRPTWHFVSSDDIYWLLELTAQQIKVSFKSRNNQLGLTNAVLRKSNSVIEKALIDGNHLSREELINKLKKAKIATDENRASHLFAWAEMEGLICSGASKKGKQTYALLEERVQKKKIFLKDEALATLARKYFTSRCPATLQDFVWWSGLSVTNAKQALEMVRSKFTPETINSQTYWFTSSFSIPKTTSENVFLLPAYDEFIISYKDRSATLPFDATKKTVSDNGIFKPVVVVNGQVRGIWKRTVSNDRVFVDVELFEAPDKTISSHIEDATEQYGRYLVKKTELNIEF